MIPRFVFRNKWILILAVYIGLMLIVVKWGIPNKDHPYPYQMDEWHQLNSVRAVFKEGTPNIEGAAYGPMFQFLLSGIYLAPFALLKIIDPFSVKSGLTNLEMIGKIFIVLRLNTLIFGILSVFVLAKISQKFFKINPVIPVAFFVFTPIFLSLSNYFKYDIALVFWLLLSLFWLLKYGKDPNLKNYLMAGIACGLAIATKISSLPLVVIYVFSFFLFNRKNQRKFSQLFLGNIGLIVTFILLGVPYLLFRKGNFGDFFTSNLVKVPSETANFFLGTHYLIFLIFKQVPTIFGHPLALLFAASLVFLILKQKNNFSKNETLIIFSFLIFAVSLIPLKIFISNRALVLLPFIALIVGIFWEEIFQKKKCLWLEGLLLIFLIIQMIESLGWLQMKLGKDPRQIASWWFLENVKQGTRIGIESIPIYQMVPDIVLKEYYGKESNLIKQSSFQYQIVDSESKSLPEVVIVTNSEIAQFQKDSSKKRLLSRLAKEGFYEASEFVPGRGLNYFFSDKLNFFISNLVPSPIISVYFSKNISK